MSFSEGISSGDLQCFVVGLVLLSVFIKDMEEHSYWKNMQVTQMFGA